VNWPLADYCCGTLVAAVRTVEVSTDGYLGRHARTVRSDSHADLWDPVRRGQRNLAFLSDVDRDFLSWRLQVRASVGGNSGIGAHATPRVSYIHVRPLSACRFRKFRLAWIRIIGQNHRFIDSDVYDRARARHIRFIYSTNGRRACPTWLTLRTHHFGFRSQGNDSSHSGSTRR
jgi:hypothetical protein